MVSLIDEYGWKVEHTGTERAVRSKLGRIKKNDPKYFTRREWKIVKNYDGYCVLRSRSVVS